MSRKIIKSIYFILTFILCLGCSNKTNTQNPRDADIVYLSSEQVSIDENLFVILKLYDEIHLIELLYFDIHEYIVESENTTCYFANTLMSEETLLINIGFKLECLAIIKRNQSFSLFVVYYSQKNIFYLTTKQLTAIPDVWYYHSPLTISTDKEKFLFAKQYALYSLIRKGDSITASQIVDILEEGL